MPGLGVVKEPAGGFFHAEFPAGVTLCPPEHVVDLPPVAAKQFVIPKPETRAGEVPGAGLCGQPTGCVDRNGAQIRSERRSKPPG